MSQSVSQLLTSIPNDRTADVDVDADVDCGCGLKLLSHVGWVGRLISISVNNQEVLIQNVPHHFQIALLPAVESLITLTNCGGQLTQLFRT